MKRFVFILAILVCGVAVADTITINWLNEDKTVSSTSTCTVGGDVILPNNIPQKRGYTFKGYVDNYTPVEYIESTGVQYINTGVSAGAGDTRMKTKAILTSTNNGGLFGSTESRMGYFYLSINNKQLKASYGNQNVSFGTTLNDNDSLEMDWKGSNLIVRVNNVEYIQALSGTWSIYSGIVYIHSGPKKLYYFQIYKNNVLVRDFIPVADSKGVACLYDRVEHKFYYNAGSGEFIAGPVIQ